MISSMLLHGLGPTICRKMDLLFLNGSQLVMLTVNRVGKEGSNHQAWERATWPALQEVAEKYPEAGLHFRGMFSDHGVLYLVHI